MNQINRLISFEGSKKNKDGRHILYKCPADKWTCGYGRNIQDRGISEEEALFMLQNDIEDCNEDLKKIFPKWLEFSGGRRVALRDVRFQHGAAGFRLYQKMISAVLRDDWNGASFHLLDSAYARKHIQRSNDNAELLRSG